MKGNTRKQRRGLANDRKNRFHAQADWKEAFKHLCMQTTQLPLERRRSANTCAYGALTHHLTAIGCMHILQSSRERERDSICRLNGGWEPPLCERERIQRSALGVSRLGAARLFSITKCTSLTFTAGWDRWRHFQINYCPEVLLKDGKRWIDRFQLQFVTKTSITDSSIQSSEKEDFEMKQFVCIIFAFYSFHQREFLLNWLHELY